MIDFPKRVVQCRKMEDGSVGVDYMEKEKIIQDERKSVLNIKKSCYKKVMIVNSRCSVLGPRFPLSSAWNA